MELNTNNDRPGTLMKPASVAALGIMLGSLLASAWMEGCPNGEVYLWL